MVPMPGIRPAELVILAGVAGLTCAAPLMAAVVMSKKRGDTSQDG